MAHTDPSVEALVEKARVELAWAENLYYAVIQIQVPFGTYMERLTVTHGAVEVPYLAVFTRKENAGWYLWNTGHHANDSVIMEIGHGHAVEVAKSAAGKLNGLVLDPSPNTKDTLVWFPLTSLEEWGNNGLNSD